MLKMHNTSLAERLKFLDMPLAESREAHEKEMELAQEKAGAGHVRLAEHRA